MNCRRPFTRREVRALLAPGCDVQRRGIWRDGRMAGRRAASRTERPVIDHSGRCPEANRVGPRRRCSVDPYDRTQSREHFQSERIRVVLAEYLSPESSHVCKVLRPVPILAGEEGPLMA
jgi:hypothetical protein